MMNKMKKVVGASMIGALTLAPVGTAFATMTAANVDNFYNMPLTVARLNYNEHFVGLIFRRKVVYLNMVVLKSDVTEDYADARYESMGREEVTWGTTLLRKNLAGVAVNKEVHLLVDNNFQFRSDSFGLIYYAAEFEDGSYYHGKISYAPCNDALNSGGYNEKNYESRIYYTEDKVELSQEEGEEGYMSSYTEAKYTGGNQVLTSYAYRLELKSQSLTGLPADVKTMEQQIAERKLQKEQEAQAAAEQAQLEAERQELLDQIESGLAEIERLQNELDNASSDENTAELESLRDELTAMIETKSAEIERLQNELIAQSEANAERMEELKTGSETEIAAKLAEIESLQNQLNEKKAEYEAEIGDLKDKLEQSEKDAADEAAQLRDELEKTEAAWQAQIREKQAEIDKKEAEFAAEIEEIRVATEKALQQKMAEVAALETQLDELGESKTAEIEALKAQLTELEQAKLAEADTLKAQLNELEKSKLAETASLRAELANLEASKTVEVEAVMQKLSESEIARANERQLLEAKLAELEEKLSAEPLVQTDTIYVDRVVTKEVEVEKECEVALATDSAQDSGIAATTVGTATDAEDATPDLHQKEKEKPWWILALVGAGVCGLAYWWLAAEPIKKKKK